MARYELSDEQYLLIEPFLPINDGKVGHPYDPHRPILNGIFWRLHAGAAWPDIPERYGNWKTIYDRYTSWRRAGIWDRILKALQTKLDAQGAIDWEQWSLDGTIVRAHRVAAGAEKSGPDGDAEPANHALGRAVGGYSTKIHLLSDGNGIPLDAMLTPGQTHESTQVETVMEHVAIERASGRVRRRPRRLAADRAYDAQRIRHFLRSRGIKPIIPPRQRKGKRKRGRPVGYDRERYRGRSAIAQCVGWLKECRAVATRYEKLALNYLGLVKLACIERYLRLLTRATVTVCYRKTDCQKEPITSGQQMPGALANAGYQLTKSPAAGDVALFSSDEFADYGLSVVKHAALYASEEGPKFLSNNVTRSTMTSNAVEKAGYYTLSEIQKMDPALESANTQYFTRR